ncbi:fibronectin type III domain-containing protein [Spirilliplanes yamanashiensis]|uniref:Fibronectin type-III domain-containing protein n=1 Tax=Spirilliplanes yamanashiensis TaxID=42233 RepID=A0A8J4DLR2_9ACTN|nr:fibronectin type III domain-containing protein [Spirilliplanes yamanashiensis]MDP9819049.1 hypothetical protein [Spirilliplanes yamanashiensis]GIJ05504.1 hypothetical protein Sya03_48560 [Spirilliplanes yamanashiensis]
MRTTVPAAALLALLTACGAPPPAAADGLTATLTSPVDVTLRWPAAEPGAAGQIVEFATDAAGPWTILAFLPADARAYDHPDLMPETTFHYRVRPLRGEASPVVDVRLPPAGADEPAADTDLGWADPRTEPARNTGAPRPGGAPTGLAATVMTRDAVRFTWSDNAAGEDGQLLEVLPAGAAAWTVAMAVDPDVNAVGLMTLATERRASFRVRAVTYGPASPVVRARTGRAPGDS